MTRFTDNLRFLASKKDGEVSVSRVPSATLVEAADEIERLRQAVDRSQQQYERSQRYWVEAARKALDGDTEHLQLRIDMAQSGPIEMTETK